MKTKLEDWIEFIKGKRIAVIGAGISNRPLIAWLHGLGADLTIFDQMDSHDPDLLSIKERMSLQGIEAIWHTGPGYLDKLTGFDVIVRTPKMKTDLPQLIRERERGAVITSEIALFAELCPAPLYAVTGSDGKTTTTTLIGLMLEAGGHTVHVGGNIGLPLIDRIASIKPTDRVVLELSSFQLMDMLPLVNRAVITNIIPNHLDFHKDFLEYQEAKKNIFRAQGVLDILVLNALDPVSSAFQTLAPGQTRLFNKKPAANQISAWRQDGSLWIQEGRQGEATFLVSEDQVILPGEFNLENILAAASLIWDDCPVQAIHQVATSFKGVANRIEWLRELDGVRWYNSSVDSSPDRTKKTLEAFRQRGDSLVLITGGQDKNSDYRGLGKAIASTSRRIILCGQNAELIHKIIQEECQEAGVTYDQLNISWAASHDEAVRIARELAEPGDAVVLSPAGTSYDRYRNFDERGDYFRNLVRAL